MIANTVATISARFIAASRGYLSADLIALGAIYL